MNVEKNRLRTFCRWPGNAMIFLNATRIAEAGFFYTGQGLELQCFQCGTRISDWNYGDQAMDRHRLAEPTCPFVIDPSSTCNVPYVPVANDVESTSDLQLTGIDENLDSATPEVHCSSSTPVQNAQVSQEYATVGQRLQSFIDWPKASIVSSEELANAGFYYRGFSDMVECAFCKGVVLNWKSGDNPDRVHRINFPNCDFYMRQDMNDVISKLANISILPDSTMASLRRLGIQIHKAPCKPEYATYEARLQTYEKWPTNVRQTPEMLSTAGFYYVGYSDHVRCFCCDGGLRDWEPTDDVWFEHARWFSRCDYVMLIRGQKYITHCIQNRPAMDPAILNSVPEEESGAGILFISNTTSSVPTNNTSSMPTASSSMPTASSSMPTTSSSMPTTSSSMPTASSSISTILNRFNIVTLISDAQLNELLADKIIQPMLNIPQIKAMIERGFSLEQTKRILKSQMLEYNKALLNTRNNFEILRNKFLEEMGIISRTNFQPSYISIDTSDESVIETEVRNDPMRQSNETTNNTAQSNVNINDDRTCESDMQEFSALVGEIDMNKLDITVLQEENRKLKEARLCKICMDHDLAVAFLPCAHLATCTFCAPSLTFCPMCRIKILAQIRIFVP